MSRAGACVLGAAFTLGTRELVRALSRADEPRLTRTNFRGRRVNLAGGLGTAAGAVAAAAGVGGHEGAAAAFVTASAGALGAIDDQNTRAADKGLRGHLRALTEGRLTTGAAKLLGISGAAIVGAALATRARPTGPAPGSLARMAGRGTIARVADVLSSAALIAGSANLLNLFDLRPGRALKAGAVLSVPAVLSRGAGGHLATGALAVIAASWPTDLAEETMLGDAGANALGALVGTALALHPDRRLRGAVLTAVVTLTVLSEKVSFSQVIERTPPLRALDAWGRSG